MNGEDIGDIDKVMIDGTGDLKTFYDRFGVEPYWTRERG